jgi:hypothetical protein
MECCCCQSCSCWREFACWARASQQQEMAGCQLCLQQLLCAAMYIKGLPSGGSSMEFKPVRTLLDSCCQEELHAELLCGYGGI